LLSSTKRLNSGLAALAAASAARSFSALPLFTTSSSQMKTKKMLQKFWSKFYGKKREKNSAKKQKKKTHKRATTAELRREEEREVLSAKHVRLLSRLRRETCAFGGDLNVLFCQFGRFSQI
jgi:hypothetical protein